MKNFCFLLILCLSLSLKAQIQVTHPDYLWINQQQGTSRPEFVWQDAEDISYHSSSIGNKYWATAPEFYAFLSQNWVFNRAMQWKHTTDGNIFYYSYCDMLKLTGNNQVSKW